MNKKINLYCKNIVLEDKIIEGILTINGDVIEKINSFPKKTEIQEAENFSNSIIIPGIIDVHNHGFKSWSAKTIYKDEIKGLSKILPSIGVTSSLATTTGWKEHEFSMLRAISDAIDEGLEGAKILGIHMEGPFFNPEKHNATPRNEVIAPSIEKCEEYWQAAKGKIKYMTLAPEMEGALNTINWLTKHGVVVGAGHTMATDQDIQKAFAAGLKVSIHTGNAMRQIDRREIGALGSVLLNKEIICEIICDFVHLSPRMLEIMFKLKNDMDKFMMISDSDTLAGVEPGVYYAYGKRVHVNEDGHILLDDGTIAGSSKYVLYGMKNLVRKMHLPLTTVSKMSSLNPAKILNIDNKTGSIKQNKQADIVVIDSDFNVQRTYVDGNIVYEAGDEISINPMFKDICIKLDEQI